MAELVQDLNATKARQERESELYKALRAWASATRKDLLFELAQLDFEERIALEGELRLRARKNTKTKIKKFYGFPERVNISFPAQAFWVEYGVGKGRPIGSAKAKRLAREWINPTITPRVARLADSVAENFADIVADQVKIIVPGALTGKVTGGKKVQP